MLIFNNESCYKINIPKLIAFYLPKMNILRSQINNSIKNNLTAKQPKRTRNEPTQGNEGLQNRYFKTVKKEIEDDFREKKYLLYAQ